MWLGVQTAGVVELHVKFVVMLAVQTVGAAEHVVRISISRDSPVTQVLVETAGTVEHTVHILDIEDLPATDVVIEVALAEE